MKVLAVASEIVPLVKTGGLADVVGALPAALAQEGVSVRTLLPGYAGILGRGRRRAIHEYDDLFGGPARLVPLAHAGLDLIVLDAPHLFDRPGGPYGDPSGSDWPDNWRRFAALGRTAADLARGVAKGYRPDILHAHDWQAALAPAYLRYGAIGVPSVMTIHNLAFQGQFPASIFSGLGLPDAAMSLDGVEYYGGVGYLKAGLHAAAAITTVSPTYAQEIRTPEFGMGLDGLVNLRSRDLHGILNGIDVDIWNPATDPHLIRNYGVRTLAARAANRGAIEDVFGLEPDGSPIVCVISRLTWQKGMDLLADGAEQIVGAGARLAILGSGDHGLEGRLFAAAARHRGRAGMVIGYDEALSHLLQAGADAIVIPSRFEPCGLTQLYALRYGCIPVVARTGGLADTVIDANEAALSAGAATGLVFQPGSTSALVEAIGRTVALHADRAAWQAMQRQGMKADVSWRRSAGRYADLFRKLIGEGRQ